MARFGGWHLAEIHTTLEESQLAPLLDAVLARFEAVQIGSYPRWSRGAGGQVTLQVRVTLEASAQQAPEVEHARVALLASLPPDSVVASPSAPA